ncbi:MAG: DUF1810 domain-containing protein [Pseudomonadota bacterium]
MDDQFDLDRFILAQAPLYEAVLSELRAGHKRSHWIWFVFPQLAGLGRSATARHYALASLAEAQAYLAHPLLGMRLLECSALVLATSGRTIEQIFPEPDYLKLRSSMTLFGRADPGEPLFQACLDKYFGGIPDAATLALLAA